ncbi:helix-turn-helix domain-containing protein [Gluconacetobacter sp. Hr-1-5]|uniref:helix-turn-helix domain-containing protein n=1 Tax=Gluconacetobacter sp. Hr-1-5 TaxID=3395370 RepID=UPI003B52798C
MIGFSVNSTILGANAHKSTGVPVMLDLSFSTPNEVVKRLCERLRMERLARQMTQADVAGRAGIGINTVSNLEAGRNVGFENVVRVAMVLGRIKELEGLFLPKLDSLEDVRRYENSARRHRVKRKASNA